MSNQREDRVLWGTGRSVNNTAPADPEPPHQKPAESAQQQTRRRTILYAGRFIIGGIGISAAILVLMFLFARSALESGGWILLLLPLITAGILAAFASRMPVTTVKVPDGAIYVLVDNSNNVKRILPTGEYHIPPGQSYTPYLNQGIFTVKFGGDKDKGGDEWIEFRAGNSLSYPVQCQVVCKHAIEDVDESRRSALLKLNKAGMAEMLRPEIEFIIRDNLFMYKHDELDHNITMPQVLNQIRVAIERLVNSKKQLFGISHVNTLLAIDPPDQVRRAVAQRVALEKFAIENPEAFEKLIGRTAGIELDKDGYLKFTLTPAEEVKRIPLLERLFETLSQIAPLPPLPYQRAGLPEPRIPNPEAKPPAGEEVHTAPLRVEKDVPEEDTQPVRPQPRPTTQPEADEDTQRLPKNPIFGHKSKPIIDMDEKDGVYERRPPRD